MKSDVPGMMVSVARKVDPILLCKGCEYLKAPNISASARLVFPVPMPAAEANQSE